MISVLFFRWIRGYVDFEFKGGFCEGFLNDVYEARLNVYSLEKHKECLCGKAGVHSYKKLHSIALKNGGCVNIVKKHGIAFAGSSLRNRAGLALGAFLFVLFLSYFGGFVWNVEIQGNEALSKAEIASFLNANNFCEGVRWSKVNRDNLEFSMMAQFDEIAWVHINRRGSTAVVEIEEGEPKPEILDESKVSNVVAAKDGVIVKTMVSKGWQSVKVGDAVTKGDLLVSGIYYSEVDEKNHFVHARGDVFAKCSESISVNLPRVQSKKNYEKAVQYKTIYFFGMKIPLYLTRKTGVNYDESVSEKRLEINNCTLPLGIITQKVKKYSVSSQALSNSELKVLAKKQIAKQKKISLSDYEVLSEKISYEFTSSGVCARANYNCIENISQTREISGAESENQP